MPDYRVYTVREDDHFFAPPKIIGCVDDQEAVEKAQQLVNGYSIEVWEGARLIIKIDPENKS